MKSEILKKKFTMTPTSGDIDVQVVSSDLRKGAGRLRKTAIESPDKETLRVDCSLLGS